jgi:hypothetical protein
MNALLYSLERVSMEVFNTVTRRHEVLQKEK